MSTYYATGAGQSNGSGPDYADPRTPGPAIPAGGDGSVFPWVLQATTTTPNALITGGAQAAGVVTGVPQGTNPVAVAVGAPPPVTSGLSMSTLLLIGVAAFFLFGGHK